MAAEKDDRACAYCGGKYRETNHQQTARAVPVAKVILYPLRQAVDAHRLLEPDTNPRVDDADEEATRKHCPKDHVDCHELRARGALSARVRWREKRCDGEG